MRFEHLHTHSHYSLLDGLSTIEQLCERSLEIGCETVTITDHGTMAGVPELFRVAKSYGLKPIAGMEAYWCDDITMKSKESKTYHLTLLAKNLDGYKSLCQLVTESYRSGFYSKPRLDLNLLLKYKKGLIVLSGCLNSSIAQSILESDHMGALDKHNEFRTKFGDDFYLEYMDSGIKSQKAINLTFDRWRREYGTKGVATQDSHYIFEDDKHVHQTLLCVGSRSTVKAPKFKFDGGPYHLATGEEMGAIFDKQLLRTTWAITDECEYYDIPKSGSMPSLSGSALGGRTPNKYLEKIAWEGLKKRKLRKKIYVNRLREELTVVYQLGFSAYFIMVADILRFARSRSILVGPGRGSSAGSLLAYCLRITDIDPLIYGLYFERFLNKNRISPPDIDVDVADSGRQEVLAYIRETYGDDRVAHVGSTSTMGPRQAIRDVCMAHGLNQEKIGGVLKQIPHDPMIKFDDVKRLSVMTELPKQVMLEAEVLSGKMRHMTTHAAGIIIADHKLADKVPLIFKEGFAQTLYNMDDMASLGYIKFDILGLKTLGVIDRTIKAASLFKSPWIEMNKFDDERVFDLLCRGETMGVFQLEGWGCTQMVKRYQPRTFEDIMMINALYRPGPMQGGEGLEIILRRRNGDEPIVYKVKEFEQILNNTYGMPVFQEQVMRMCQVFAGFTLAEADAMRSAIGKKDEAKMASYRTSFIHSALQRGHKRSVADEIWEDITFFNRYGWNRAHAAAYGAVTYYTAWLKTHYKEFFMAELINSEKDAERLKKLIGECHRLDIQFERVDINESELQYTVSQDRSLLPGFASIKGVGIRSAQAILDARGRGKFYSTKEAREKVPRKLCNKLAWEALEKAGAFKKIAEKSEMEECPF